MAPLPARPPAVPAVQAPPAAVPPSRRRRPAHAARRRAGDRRPPPRRPRRRGDRTPRRSRGRAHARLLEVVSERTGYPTDMLDLDADLEADLGIDSIKRVEIAGTIMQTLTLPEGATLDAEQMTASRTLREVVDVLEALVRGDAPPARAAAHAHAEDEPVPFDSVRTGRGARIGRFVLQVARRPAAGDRGPGARPAPSSSSTTARASGRRSPRACAARATAVVRLAARRRRRDATRDLPRPATSRRCARPPRAAAERHGGVEGARAPRRARRRRRERRPSRCRRRSPRCSLLAQALARRPRARRPRTAARPCSAPRAWAARSAWRATLRRRAAGHGAVTGS